MLAVVISRRLEDAMHQWSIVKCQNGHLGRLVTRSVVVASSVAFVKLMSALRLAVRSVHKRTLRRSLAMRILATRDKIVFSVIGMSGMHAQLRAEWASKFVRGQ
jgi:hypothetical protein